MSYRNYRALRFRRGMKHVRKFLDAWHGNKSSASVFKLQERVGYGGRKGKRAASRLRSMGIRLNPTPRGFKTLQFSFSDVTFTIGGKKLEGVGSINYEPKT